MQEIMKSCSDKYIWSKQRKVLTWEQLHIDGLEMIGHMNGGFQTYKLSYHCHRAMEFVYIVSGSQSYFINDTEYVANGNQIFWVNSDVLHGTDVKLHGRYEFFWFRVIKLPNKAFLNLDDVSGELLWQSLQRLPENIITPQKNLKKTLESAMELLGYESELSRVAGCSLLVQFLCEIANASNSNKNTSSEIGRAVEYIDSNINQNIALETLAEISGLSLSRFKTRFRQEIQISPREYINLRKIETAKEMLSSTSKSITEIALELDFTTANYFAVLFRQIVGITPTEYRKLKRFGYGTE